MRSLVVVVSLTACGGTSLEGTYRVDDVVTLSCDDTDPQPVQYLFEWVDFYRDDGTLTSELCDDAAERSCSQLRTWTDAPGGATTDDARGAFVIRFCELDYLTFAATVDGDHLQLVSTRYTQSMPASSSTGCDAEAARTRGVAMPCAGKQRIDATRADAPFPH